MLACPLFCEFREPNKTAKLKQREYPLEAKIGQNYYIISNCMFLIRQNKRAKIILHAKSRTFMAAKLKGFTVIHSYNQD